MTSEASRPPDYSTHKAGSVNEFINYLLVAEAHWNQAKRGDLAYRGQASSSWSLVPKAFRAGQKVNYDREPHVGLSNRVTTQARAEFTAIHQFVRAADASGLQITEAGSKLLFRGDPRQVFQNEHWEYDWPQQEVLETVALAQHHGVPTRLLDFTEDPLIAAYFAASSAWDSHKDKILEGKHVGDIAVWVVDLRFVRAIDALVARYPERVAEVRVPRANNSYLHAQLAFFLMDRGANDLIGRSEPLSIDRAISERARFWHTGRRLQGKKIERTWFDEIPTRQVQLPTSLTGDLLKELDSRGITRASMMPSLDRVVESLEFQRDLP